ncbi:hypothetical protein E9934_18200 [Nocardioides caeni]|uniref:SGNH hydrolase-type esterase domain-containing protein n=1 Tax=Nocardioides caeni TaxID=574700 RepID=A0A4S8N004_9ACTN|nr:GDSL-type esterase/lipase family protein [Nocardioides caeni]THV08945.1 hypothetical protein E9934_18200 [Nocardioides caeni]
MLALVRRRRASATTTTTTTMVRAFVLAAVGAVGASLLAIVGSGVSAAPAGAAPGAAPLRVMVVGDSISQGFGGDATWRYWFWRETQRQGVPLDFVGPDTGFVTGYGTRYEFADPRFDRDHAARGGSTINNHLARIDGLMATYAPQVVVIELGVNDALRGDNGATIAAELEEMVERVWSSAAGTRVVLAGVPRIVARPEVSAAAAEANRLLAQRFALDSRVLRVVDTAAPATRTGRLTSDGLHPNATGQTHLAQRFAEAFRSGGYLPQEPAIFHERTWSPKVIPRVVPRTVGGRRTVVVDWRVAAAEVRMRRVRIRISQRGSGLVRDTAWLPSRSDRISLRVGPGVYDVQLVPRRASMIGAPGPRVRVRVR